MNTLLREFSAIQNCTYLNTPAHGLLPRSVMEWRRQQDCEFVENPRHYLSESHGVLKQTKNKLAQYFNVAVDEIALIPNFSLGLNAILDALNPNKKVLLLENDYPSVNWPVEARSFDCFYAQIDEDLEKNILDAVRKHQPNVFIFSLVQWLNGIKIDFNFLHQLKNEFPNLLIIADGTQYLGTEDFDFQKSAIDILSASAYKWLTAGFGNAFILIKKEAQSQLTPRILGFNSSTDFQNLPDEAHFINHFEPGHLDALTLGSIGKSIEVLEGLNPKNLYATISNLSFQAKTIFTEMDLLTSAVVQRINHSNIFNLNGDDAMFQKLTNAGIVCAQRGGGIRVGFHYYNTENDLDKLVEIFKN